MILEIIYPLQEGLADPRHAWGWSSGLGHHLDLHGRCDTQVCWRHHQLLLRMPADLMPQALNLKGIRLSHSVAKCDVVLGAPLVREIKPYATLYSHMCIFKRTNKGEGDRGRQGVPYLRALARALEKHQIGRVRHELEPRYIVFKARTYHGYALTLTDLTPQQSIALQTHGLGSMANYGCGVFVHHKGNLLC
jgi:CRISPR-associated protein Cas6